jgi:hypothetical protein
MTRFFPLGGDAVTLRVVTWGWSATDWFGSLTSPSVTPPPDQPSASDDFPKWTGICPDKE